MKSMNKRITAIALSALLAGTAGSVLAFGGHHEQNRHCDQGDLRAPMAQMNRLEGLSDEQKTQLQQVRRETRDAMRDLHYEMRQNRDALRDAITDGKPAGEIQPLAKKQGDMVARMIVLRAKTRQKIDSLLTDDQRAQLDSMRRPGRDFDRPRDRMRY